MSSQALEADSQICLNKNIYICIYVWISSHKHFVQYAKHHFPLMAPSKRENQFHILYLSQPISQRSWNSSLLDFTNVTF